MSEQPDAVLRPGSVDDIARMLRFARRHGIRVVGRGAAHTTFGQSQHPASIVFDLTSLDTIGPIGDGCITVDAGCRWNAVLAAHAGARPHAAGAPRLHRADGGRDALGGRDRRDVVPRGRAGRPRRRPPCRHRQRRDRPVLAAPAPGAVRDAPRRPGSGRDHRRGDPAAGAGAAPGPPVRPDLRRSRSSAGRHQDADGGPAVRPDGVVHHPHRSRDVAVPAGGDRLPLRHRPARRRGAPRRPRPRRRADPDRPRVPRVVESGADRSPPATEPVDRPAPADVRRGDLPRGGAGDDHPGGPGRRLQPVADPVAGVEVHPTAVPDTGRGVRPRFRPTAGATPRYRRRARAQPSTAGCTTAAASSAARSTRSARCASTPTTGPPTTGTSGTGCWPRNAATTAATCSPAAPTSSDAPSISCRRSAACGRGGGRTGTAARSSRSPSGCRRRTVRGGRGAP